MEAMYFMALEIAVIDDLSIHGDFDITFCKVDG